MGINVIGYAMPPCIPSLPQDRITAGSTAGIKDLDLPRHRGKWPIRRLREERGRRAP
jgi:hypothetical protein